MINIVDFTNCKLSNRNLQYAGRAEEKRGIIYNNELWFLKFPKNTRGMDNIKGLSYVTSPLSEYYGSKIYEILGYEVHKTILGIFNDGKNDKVVCACKDFINDDKNELLIPYTALRNDTNKEIMEKRDSSFDTPSNIEEILFQLNNNSILKNIPDAIKRFWDVVVIDLLINNNDRNEDNWGVIKDKNNETYRLSPIYDNGNSFYSKTDESRIASILTDESRLISSSINGITAYDMDNNTLTFQNVLKINNNQFRKSLEDIYNLFISKFDYIVEMINEVPEYYKNTLIVSDNRKKYYIETIKIRLDCIRKVIENNNPSTK